VHDSETGLTWIEVARISFFRLCLRIAAVREAASGLY